MTKEEIYEKLETEVKLRGLSPKTYITYKESIRLFLDWADKPYESLEEIDFRNYLIYLVNRGDLSTSTINMYNASIRFLLEVILGKNINYRRTARLRKVFNLPNVWSKETIERFFSVIDDPRDRAIFLNIYGSGLRVSEIVNLKIQDIDSKSMRLLIRHHIMETNMTELNLDELEWTAGGELTAEQQERILLFSSLSKGKNVDLDSLLIFFQSNLEVREFIKENWGRVRSA